jgi:hypothetical protein
MLFLYRPRQTWMPFSRPMSGTEQAAYNRRLQMKFDSSRRVPPAAPAAAVPDPAGQLSSLEQLHRSGVLSDAEFAAARARLTARGVRGV